MTRRLSTLLVPLLLSACVSEAPPMWAGPDLSQPLLAASGPSAPALPAATLISPSTQPPPVRRVGGGTPPDLLRGAAETVRPPTLAPLTSAPTIPSPAPSPLDGPGFQRTGPITYGPGGVYNSVGSTIFGPGGKVCTPVGSSLTCL